MEFYTYSEQLEWVNEFIKCTVYIVLPALVGSYASDYFKTLKQEDIRISFRRIILAAAIAVVITFIFLDWLIYTNRRALLPLVSLVFGLLGFELLYGLSSIDNMVTLLKKISSLLNPIFLLIRQINEVRILTSKQDQYRSNGNADRTKDDKSEDQS